jgi:6-phosphogluconolactonase
MIALRRFASEEAWLAAIEADFLETLSGVAPGPVALCLAGGTTPAPAYRRLASALLREFPARDKLKREPRALLVVGDERDGAVEARYRNDEAIKAAWAEALAAGRASLVGWERSPAEPAAMERRLAELAASRPGGRPLFELCYLGLGADGHTAGLFPGDQSIAAGSADGGRLGESVPLALRGRAPDYPFERLSLNFNALRSAGGTRYLVRSRGKEAALAALEAGDGSCPAVRAASADALAFVLD